MMKRSILRTVLLVVVLTFSLVVDASVPEDSLQNGDLLFAVNPKGNAITEVTIGVGNTKIDHVGMVIRKTDGIFVMEATKRKGVGMTPLSEFVAYNTVKYYSPMILVGRVKTGLDFPKVEQLYRKYEHLPYDSLFLPDDRAMYCSELVQKIAVDHLGRPVFGTIPMSFHDNTGKVTAYWKKFYRQFGMEVPEGAPGTNPGQLSRDHHVRILGFLKKAY
ncbi:MAG: YiiX/YebB-like N1pC/P60 family cysteine hydrolase [Prevotellaceae bacterium]|nr:YiiX/YebB-like N1pC/P60 family cysteine hydrolase [Prevotellaceae bacterium]